MMNKDQRKQLRKKLEQRILRGEDKADIYAEYEDELEAKLVAIALAQIPTLKRRKQFRLFNWILIGALGVFAALKIFVFTTYIPSQIDVGTFFLLITPAINFFLIWLVVKFRGMGYLLAVAFGISAFLRVMTGFDQGAQPLDFTINVISLVCGVTSITIAAMLMKKLLPKTGFFLMPKKDSEGKPLFEQ